MSDRDNRRTHSLIPGGAHTYSKGDDQFSANAPTHLERGEGAWVWDRDGNRFLDWTAGLRTMSLGYGIEPVIQAAVEQIRRGSNFGRPSFIETDYAERLVASIPSAEMAKFAKNGSTVTSAAVKLARAFTGRDYVAFCQDHPFFSFDDWFIGTTPCDSGVPSAFGALSLPFRYNDLKTLEFQFDSHPGKIACVIMEAATMVDPLPGFLEGVQALCRKHGAVFILDEMITGFRWHLNGAQTHFNIQPDLSTFGKGMANGFAVAALVGRRDILELGGLFHNKKRVFLISTTHGAENHALAAAMATIDFFHANPVIENMWTIGRALIDGMNAIAGEIGIGSAFKAFGFPCSPCYATLDAAGQPCMKLRTLFLQEMVNAGVLINYIAPGWSHRQAELDVTLAAVRKALQVYGRAIDEGVDKYLRGPAIKPVFRAFN